MPKSAWSPGAPSPTRTRRPCGGLARQIVQANRHAYRATLRALGCFDVSPRLGEIKAPTLVVSGALDQTISLDHQHRLAKAISERGKPSFQRPVME